MDQSGDATFEDPDCTRQKPYALFGCGLGVDGRPYGAYGDFGTSALFEAAVGLALTDYLRIEAAVDYRPGLAFKGNANFAKSGFDQPVSGEVTQAGAMAFAFLEPLTALGVASPLQPFVGFGAGISRNEIGQMTYDFPELDQPRYSVTPDGTNTDFAWAVTGGVTYKASDRLSIDFAYRYSDLGKIETSAGTLFNQFSNTTLDIAILPTRTELTTQSLIISARIGF